MALRRMALDSRIRLRDLRLYAHVAPALSSTDYRPLKQYALAREIGYHRSDVGRSLQRLVRCGYLATRQPVPIRGQVHAYRLVTE